MYYCDSCAIGSGKWRPRRTKHQITCRCSANTNGNIKELKKSNINLIKIQYFKFKFELSTHSQFFPSKKIIYMYFYIPSFDLRLSQWCLVSNGGLWAKPTYRRWQRPQTSALLCLKIKLISNPEFKNYHIC